MKTKILVIALMLIGFISSAQKKPSEWSSATKDAVRTALNVDSLIDAKADGSAYYTAAQVDSIVTRKVVFTVNHAHHSSQTPSDDATAYIGAFENLGSALTSDGARTTSLPFNSTIIAANCVFWCNNSASSETFNVYVRINESADSLVTSTAAFGSAFSPEHHNITGLNIPLSASDEFETKVVFPTWATNPTSVFMEFTYYIQID